MRDSLSKYLLHKPPKHSWDCVIFFLFNLFVGNPDKIQLNLSRLACSTHQLTSRCLFIPAFKLSNQYVIWYMKRKQIRYLILRMKIYLTIEDLLQCLILFVSLFYHSWFLFGFICMFIYLWMLLSFLNHYYCFRKLLWSNEVKL